MDFINLQWTTEQPVVAGYYWSWNDYEKNAVRVAYDEYYKKLMVDYDHQWSSVLEVFTHWMGPIPEPESPTNA